MPSARRIELKNCERVCAVVLAVVLALGGEGCRWFRRAPKPTTTSAPTKPATTPLPTPPAPKPPPPPEIEPPPQLPAGRPQIAPPPVELPKPRPPRAPRRTRPVRKSQPAPPQPAEEPPKPAAPLPQLQQILTPEQEREANQVIDQCVLRVERALAALQGRRLTAEQVTSITRVKAFIEQAQQTRKTDLITARALAERASVLADDLLRSLP